MIPGVVTATREAVVQVVVRGAHGRSWSGRAGLAQPSPRVLQDTFSRL